MLVKIHRADGDSTGSGTMEINKEISQKLKIDLPYDPATPLLSTFPEDSKLP